MRNSCPTPIPGSGPRWLHIIGRPSAAESQMSSFAYLSDHSPLTVGPGPEGLGEYHENALRLAAAKSEPEYAATLRSRIGVYAGTIGAALLVAWPAAGDPAPPDDPEVTRYNYVIGTQTIGVRYGFTEDTRLVETAKAILAMGSNVLKIHMADGYEVLDGADGQTRIIIE